MLDLKCAETGLRKLISLVIVLVVSLGYGRALSESPPAPAAKGIDVIAYLTETIDWYNGRVVEQQIAKEQRELAFVANNQRISRDIVRLAFEFARAEEQSQSKQAKSGQTKDQTSAPSQYQRLAQSIAAIDLKIEHSQSELQSLRQKLETAPRKKRPALESLIAEKQSELALRQAHRDALQKMLQFATGVSVGEMKGAGLKAQIEELARSVPSALSGAGSASPEQTPAEQTPAKVSPSRNREEPSRIWGLAANVWRLARKRATIDQQIESTDQFIQTAKEFRSPLVANLRSMIQSGDQLANQPPSDDPGVLAQQKKQLDTLTAQFKQASAGLLPLGKQSILLDLYRKNLMSWRDAVSGEYRGQMQSFLIRLGILVMIVASVFAAGEAWRRAIFRYIREPRRRSQFLLLRKITIWVAIVTIISFTFLTQVGSIATFAGLITAGVAVALQNVILSIVGYFFLMGKYGIRVGDRVQIAGVTGEVVDIGLVRFHLLELSSGGTDAQPSGRVVAFSNSVVFQPSGVFKRIPGTSFVWHEIALTFSAECNYRMVQERLTAAVDRVLKDFQEEIDRQMRSMERTLNSVSAIELKPRTHLHFTTSGIEVTVRYPVELKNAVDIDDRLMREIYAAIEQEPKLKLAGSGTPALRTEPSTPP